jgi:hypothetical protein
MPTAARCKELKRSMETRVALVKDFEVTGRGSDVSWDRAAWLPLTRVGRGKSTYPSRVKVLWSRTGMYFLFDCEDRKLSCTLKKDYSDIYTEDVVEIFLQTDQRQSLYFEYEISPLGVELPILIPNHDGAFHGWRPWHYDSHRTIRRGTSVRGGRKKSLAKIEGWMAEVYIPFKLLTGLGNVPPKPGTRWRGNMYRIDYDLGWKKPTHWAWCHHTGANFHMYQEFGSIIFDG